MDGDFVTVPMNHWLRRDLYFVQEFLMVDEVTAMQLALQVRARDLRAIRDELRERQED